MNNLANDLALLGRYEDADPLMRRAYEIKMKSMAPTTRAR